MPVLCWWVMTRGESINIHTGETKNVLLIIIMHNYKITLYFLIIILICMSRAATFIIYGGKDRYMKEHKVTSIQLFLIPIGFFAVALVMLMALPSSSVEGKDDQVSLTDIELLGKYVFFDKISSPSRMSCETCHNPSDGGTGGVSGVNLHQVAITGANPHTVGNLKPPTNAYASFIDPFHPCATGGLGPQNMCGGNFWNGRAEGLDIALYPDGATKHTGDEIFYTTSGADLESVKPGVRAYSVYFGPVSDQALNPMPNPVEQNISRREVCAHVASAKYASLYKKVWGVAIDCRKAQVAVSASDLNGATEMAYDISFKRLMLSVGAWQASADLNSFSSKRDIALRAELSCACQNPEASEYPGDDICSSVTEASDPAVCTNASYLDSPGDFPLVGFTDQENLGHDLFYGKTSALNPDGKNANCATCHSDHPATFGPGGVIPGDTGSELFQLYSADDYHNIGTPPNPEIPAAYNSDGSLKDPDLGIAGHTGSSFPPGFFKTPTLRNVDKRVDDDFIKAYTHNGWFKSLESIVHFYNTAFLGGVAGPFPGAPDIPYEQTTAYTFNITRCPAQITTEKEALKNNCWPAPAYASPAIPFLVGNLHLTSEEEAALVVYMKTFSDEYTPSAPRPYK
jgi:cytochrome c peroxidase